MNYVMLDTCVLVNCTLINAPDADPELLVTIAERMRDKGLELLLPEVVKLEYGRKVPEELGLIKQQANKFRKAITTEVLTAPDVGTLHATLDDLDAKRDAAAAKGQEYFSEIAADADLTVHIALTGDIIAEATRSVLAGRKPSKGPGRGLLDPDSMIVASIASFARTRGLTEQDAILICSDNNRDFGIWDPDSGRHVIAPDIVAAIPCPVRYYKSPRLLVEEELQVDVEADKPLAQALHNYDEFAKTMTSLGAMSSYARLFKPSVPGLGAAAARDFNRVFLRTMGASSLAGLNASLFKGPDMSSLLGLNVGLMKGLDFDRSYLTGLNAGLMKGLAWSSSDLAASYDEDLEPEDEPEEEQDDLGDDSPNDATHADGD
jgi:hypothetical protein